MKVVNFYLFTFSNILSNILSISFFILFKYYFFIHYLFSFLTTIYLPIFFYSIYYYYNKKKVFEEWIVAHSLMSYCSWAKKNFRSKKFVGESFYRFIIYNREHFIFREPIGDIFTIYHILGDIGVNSTCYLVFFF